MPNQSDKPVIEFRNVVKTYHRMHRDPTGIKNVLLHLPTFIRKWREGGAFTALKDVSFEIRRGETFGICGHNGSGKSTTLGLMASVLRPTSGEIHIRGRVSPLLELGAGFHPELTGRENISLNGVILGMTRREIADRFDPIVEFSGLEEFLDVPIRAYSSGMIMRLGFSVAVHTDPEILLVDEVLAVGDAAFQGKCLSKMEEFRKGGMTIVFVTHQFSQIREMCDRAILLDQGRVEAEGTPEEVEPQYQARIHAGSHPEHA